MVPVKIWEDLLGKVTQLMRLEEKHQFYRKIEQVQMYMCLTTQPQYM